MLLCSMFSVLTYPFLKTLPTEFRYRYPSLEDYIEYKMIFIRCFHNFIHMMQLLFKFWKIIAREWSAQKHLIHDVLWSLLIQRTATVNLLVTYFLSMMLWHHQFRYMYMYLNTVNIQQRLVPWLIKHYTAYPFFFIYLSHFLWNSKVSNNKNEYLL